MRLNHIFDLVSFYSPSLNKWITPEPLTERDFYRTISALNKIVVQYEKTNSITIFEVCETEIKRRIVHDFFILNFNEHSTLVEVGRFINQEFETNYFDLKTEMLTETWEKVPEF